MRKKYEFTILLDDIVFDQGEVEAMDQLEAEEALQFLYPNYSYVINEARGL